MMKRAGDSDRSALIAYGLLPASLQPFQILEARGQLIGKVVVRLGGAVIIVKNGIIRTFSGIETAMLVAAMWRMACGYIRTWSCW